MDAIEVQTITGKGQGTFARECVLLRDEILTFNDLTISAIGTPQLVEFCYRCIAASKMKDTERHTLGRTYKAALKICTGCNVARFCGKKCQSHAWKQYHKHECKIFARLHPKILPDSMRAVIRFVLQYDHGLITEELWSKVYGLTSHSENLKNRSREWEELNLMAKAAMLASRTADEPTFLHLLCVLKTNGVTLQTSANDPIGVFLDPQIALLNHSCQPNTFLHRPFHTNEVGWPHGVDWEQHSQAPKQTLKLLPLRSIEKGEEMTISYIDVHQHVSARQAELKKQYFFKCMCSRCVDDTQADDELKKTGPEFYKQQAQWRNLAKSHLNTVYSDFPNPHVMSQMASHLTKLSKDMEDHPRFSPAIQPYQAIMQELKLLQLSDPEACDLTLICAMKQYFLIDPQLLTTPIHPTHVVNSMFVLKMLGLLHEAIFATEYPDEYPDYDANITRSAQRIRDRGFSEPSFLYWRLRVSKEMLDAVQASALSDMVPAFESAFGEVSDGVEVTSLLGDDGKKVKAEEELRRLIGFSKERWEDVKKSWK